MDNTSKNKWIAIIVSIVVIAAVFGIYRYYSLNQNGSTLGSSSNTNASSTAMNPQPINTADGLTIVDVVPGTGAEAKAGNTVSVNYVGVLQDGTKFDSSFDHGQPFSFKLGAGMVIKGWDEGVAGMKVGGKRRLIIPPSLGYGSQAAGAIPPNSTLIFEVDLLDVK